MEDFIAGFDDEMQRLETCDLPEPDYKIKPFVLVIFGGAGDLSQVDEAFFTELVQQVNQATAD